MSNWNLDTTHSHLAFEVRHMVFSKVRGEFGKWTGALVMGDGPDPHEGASIRAVVDVASLDTKLSDRDNHLRSADFFDAAGFPEAVFESRTFRKGVDNEFTVVGDLTIKGVRKEVALSAEFLGQGKDPWGNERCGFHAEATIDRRDFGLVWNVALETGGVLVGEKVKIVIDVEAVKVG